MARQYSNTKASQAVVTETGMNSIGFLNFWTLVEQHVDEGDLINSARRHSIPTWMTDRIKGRGAKSAWTNATQLGARGKPSRLLPTEPKDALARYLTRDLNEEARVIIRETTLPTNERIETENLVVMYIEGTSMKHVCTETYAAMPDASQREIDKVVSGMYAEMGATKGMVNTGRVRALILDWLDKQYRICVRGTGGVYLIPRPKDDILADQLIHELTTIQAWVKDAPLSSMFSIVEMFDSASTSKSDFVESAIAEIKDELADVENRLNRWSSNSNMNAGSRGYSASEMVTRLDSLTNKVSALKDSLGETVGIAEAMIVIVRNKAEKMAKEAAVVVTAARVERTVTDAKTPAISPNGTGKAEAKKKGTATARNKQVKL